MPIKNRVKIRRIRKGDEKSFLSLIDALADYEKLERPSIAARKRLIQDGFGRKKRFTGYLAFVNRKAVGYSIILETYSSFLALPTLYLEDIFILPEFRSQGIGRKMFKLCLSEAKKRGCGRMEWVVLDWNKPAIKFYDKIGAVYLKKWLTYRINHDNFNITLKKL
ncbi:MAG: GNAT family N-acetyltransferase [Chlorobiaceae bacterium]|nr:GNAT family N-acetyltransferase [Chlorobiaceae bacterium]